MNLHVEIQLRSRCLAAAALLGTALAAPAIGAQVSGQARLSAEYGSLPLSFEANHGQSDAQVRFLARGQGYGLFLTPSEAVLSLRRPANDRSDSTASAAVVRMRLVGANPNPQLSGLDRQPGTSNYFIGDDPARWQRDVPNFARVKASDVYPGIDLIYYGKQRQLEYDLVVAPGADPRRITLAFGGVQKISLDPEGNLVLRTSRGDIAQHAPVIYQHVDGARQSVEGRYVVRAKNRVSFQIASYDATRPLVIDPVLTYSTYLGGSGGDISQAIAVDGTGSAYVTGGTTSTDFPGASGSPIQGTLLGSGDVFVTKLNTTGTALVYSTYLGGSGLDTGYAIAVDSLGSAYVTGETDSPTAAGVGNIPYPLVGPFQATYRGGGDAFVTKINPAGNALVYSTYLGGGGNERGYGIAVDASFNAYVTGHTSTSQGGVPSPGDFPTVAPFQAQNGQFGSHDAFVTKFNASGSALLYSTFLGGNGNEFSLNGGAIAVDSDGNAYVGGTTLSSNFPGAGTSTIQPTYGGGGRSDGFVVKFNSTGSALLYSTYLGGSGDEAVNGIAIDAARNAFVVGYTTSTNFPTASPLQPSKSDAGSGEDAFVAKINAAGSALVFSTYLGGNGNGERAFGVAVDSGGNAWVSGSTSSTNFPTVAPLQANNAGSRDAFVCKFNPAGSAILFSTYLGGSTGDEFGYGIAIDSAGSAYVTGSTNSTNFHTVVPLQATFGGAPTDAFVAKILTPTGDFDGDGHPDILWRNTSTGDVYVYYMGGTGGNTALSGGDIGVVPTEWAIEGVADFDGNGTPDIVWRRPTSGVVFIYYMGGAGGRTVLTGGYIASAPTEWSIAGVADFDGDGHPDIVWHNLSTGEVYVYYMGAEGKTVLSGGGITGAPTVWTIAGVADFNRDGHPDLLWHNTSTGENYIYYLDGAGGNALLSGAGVLGAPTVWSVGAVADMNGDGHPDIVWRNTATGEAYIFYLTGAGGNTLLSGAGFPGAATVWSMVGP